jgi:hypothetical protein
MTLLLVALQVPSGLEPFLLAGFFLFVAVALAADFWRDENASIWKRVTKVALVLGIVWLFYQLVRWARR